MLHFETVPINPSNCPELAIVDETHPPPMVDRQVIGGEDRPSQQNVLELRIGYLESMQAESRHGIQGAIASGLNIERVDR